MIRRARRDGREARGNEEREERIEKGSHCFFKSLGYDKLELKHKKLFFFKLIQGEVTPIDCTNTRDWGQELGQAVKAENLEGQAVKGTSHIRKSQGSSTVKGQPDTKSHQSTIPHLVEQVRSRDYLSSGQGPNSRSNFLTVVAGVSTESME